MASTFNANAALRKLREAERKAKRAVNGYQREVASMSRRLRAATNPVPLTDDERRLTERVRLAIETQDEKEYDFFLSYARIDGAEFATQLRDELDDLDVTVWFDGVDIQPGISQARQMDLGLLRAKAGIVVLTPAFIAGRFWTERELGVLLGKPRLIPVLHKVTFEDVAKYSGILQDLAGFETRNSDVADIALKIANALPLPEIA
jgi:hypothetical protein